MLGAYYINTDGRRRAAWGPPCKPTLGKIAIDGKVYLCDVSVIPAFQTLEIIRAKYGFHQNGADTGFYNCRHMRFDKKLPYSVHSWAKALDWDWLQNPAGNKLITNMPKPMIHELLMLKTNSGAYVFMWGGDWDRNPRTGHTYYDAMHWEVIAHPLDLRTGIAYTGVVIPPIIIPVGDDDVALKNPSRGPAIAAIQRNLNLWKPELDLLDDGIFGDNTEKAIKEYQTSAVLPVTGQVDGLTASYILTVPLRKVVTT